MQCRVTLLMYTQLSEPRSSVACCAIGIGILVLLAGMLNELSAAAIGLARCAMYGGTVYIRGRLSLSTCM
jgi:hypothetical protein